MKIVVAAVSGALFALGLNLSGMTEPMKIIAFLDLSGRRTGAWDPSLIVVMCSALLVHAVGLRLFHGPRAWTGEEPVGPRTGAVDAALVGGSLMWGAGWGLSGLCPGPILAAVGAGLPGGLCFFAGMVGGMFLHAARRP